MTSKNFHPRKLTVKILVSPGPLGYRYFWARRVTGFNDQAHCYSCLKGSRLAQVNLELSQGGEAVIPAKAGELVYICGVARPPRWENNFHLAIKVVEGAVSDRTMHTGANLSVLNGELIPFDGDTARLLYPDRGEDFLTCRNFQFAAQVFGRGD